MYLSPLLPAGVVLGLFDINMGLWENGNIETGGNTMKTTVEIRDDIFRRAKAEAALRGIKFRDLVEEGLLCKLSKAEQPSESKPAVSVYDLMKDSIGIVSSGIGDLSTNPKHLEGYGKDSKRRHR